MLPFPEFARLPGHQNEGSKARLKKNWTPICGQPKIN
jgi:hypothetical protein